MGYENKEEASQRLHQSFYFEELLYDNVTKIKNTRWTECAKNEGPIPMERKISRQIDKRWFFKKEVSTKRSKFEHRFNLDRVALNVESEARIYI